MELKRIVQLLVLFVITILGQVPAAEKYTRLYNGITAFVANPDGIDFTVSLSVKDVNRHGGAPDELLAKIYGPEGRPLVRKFIPDDGVSQGNFAAPAAGWDHESWYYETCYSRGLRPAMRWSAVSEPERLEQLKKRNVSWDIEGRGKGVYRILLVGNPDLLVSLDLDPNLQYGLAGSPEWIHGSGNDFRRSYFYIPKGGAAVHALFLQFDRPRQRAFAVKDDNGEILMEGRAVDGLQRMVYRAPPGESLDDRIFSVEVSEGAGDFLLNITIQMEGKSLKKAKKIPDLTTENFDQFQPWRGPKALTAVLCSDKELARSLKGGAIYHDDKVFWQMYQVRLYDILQKMSPDDFDYPSDLPKRKGYHSVGSHERPRRGVPGWGDRVMHNYPAHKNRKALNYAIRDLFFGMCLIGHGDHVAIGPLANLAYEMGCYSYFFPRPAWRILRQSNAPADVKACIREYVNQICDRMAFCRGMALVNGNSLASLVESMRYCTEATDDVLNQRLFETYFERFETGGLGERIGIGPSGGLQESFGYDFHYGSYVLRGWNAVRHDLKAPRFERVYDRMMKFYSYVWTPVGYAIWSSRTGIGKVAGGTYNSWHKNPDYRWKGYGGPNLTVGVNGANEFFAARRQNYYCLTYHGRLTPTWMGEGFRGQIGFGGGAICQLFVPGKGNGMVITSTVNGSYGKGMHLSQWRNFHIHSVVGTTIDGQPLVTANSEHFNARLEDNTVTSSSEVRQSSVRIKRSYTFEPNSIVCNLQLAPSAADKSYALWAGPAKFRREVNEAYEMIPYADVRRNRRTGKKGKGAARLVAVDAAGGEIADLTDEPTLAQGFLIDRHGYGARIELEKRTPLLLGKNDTVLIQLADQRTHADEIELTYRIVPFSGQPPAGPFGSKGQVPKNLSLETKTVRKASELKKALAELEPFTIKSSKGKKLARLRVARSGENLALSATVSDSKIAPHKTVWKGSCLEIFASMPGTAQIGQVFLAPAAGETPARAYRAGEKIAPEPAIKLTTQPEEGGYDMQALVPFSALKVDPSRAKIMLEFQVTSVGGPGGKLTRGTLFDSIHAYENNQRYGLFILNPEAE
ncbi:MAG: hypothetical protein ACLFWL_00605 [Candidatus Brocadiia bacterium]